MLLVALLVLLGGDELVDVLELLIVTGVRHHGAVVAHAHVGALVLEAAHCGVLERGGVRVLGVDLHHPAEAVGLVLVPRDAGVEALLYLGPAAGGHGGGEAVALLLGGAGGDEVLVDVLLAGEHGAPRGHAARAVVLGAQHALARGVVLRLEQVRAGRGAVHHERGGQGDAPVAGTAAHVGPGLPHLGAGDLHDRHAVGLDGGLHHVGQVGLLVARGEHGVLVGVLVVVHQHTREPVGVRDDVQVVGVVAELLGLRLRGLVLGVELRGVVEQGVAPADDGRPVVALGDVEIVHRHVHRLDGGEVQAGLAFAPVAVRGLRGLGGGGHQTHRDGSGGTEPEGGAAGHRGGDDVLHVLVAGGVGVRGGALAAALELARERAALAVHVAQHGQETAAFGCLGHGVAPWVRHASVHVSECFRPSPQHPGVITPRPEGKHRVNQVTSPRLPPARRGCAAAGPATSPGARPRRRARRAGPRPRRRPARAGTRPRGARARRSRPPP